MEEARWVRMGERGKETKRAKNTDGRKENGRKEHPQMRPGDCFLVARRLTPPIFSSRRELPPSRRGLSIIFFNSCRPVSCVSRNTDHDFSILVKIPIYLYILFTSTYIHIYIYIYINETLHHVFMYVNLIKLAHMSRFQW